jgi:serine/threonine protein kinase
MEFLTMLNGTKNNMQCACGRCSAKTMAPPSTLKCCKPHMRFGALRCLGHGKMNSEISLELMDGNFLDLIHDPIEPDYSTKVSYLHQIACGIKEMHDRKIMHRDLKPSNILYKRINGKIVIKLADYGSAEIFDKTHYLRNLVTLNYRAPEAFTENYTESIDIWSFGCIAYELIFGHILFNWKLGPPMPTLLHMCIIFYQISLFLGRCVPAKLLQDKFDASEMTNLRRRVLDHEFINECLQEHDNIVESGKPRDPWDIKKYPLNENHLQVISRPTAERLVKMMENEIQLPDTPVNKRIQSKKIKCHPYMRK